MSNFGKPEHFNKKHWNNLTTLAGIQHIPLQSKYQIGANRNCMKPHLEPDTILTLSPRPLSIGILGLQGAFVEHVAALNRLDPSIQTVIIRSLEDFETVRLDGIILPGGESTTMSIVAERTGILEKLKHWVFDDRPTMVHALAESVK